MQLIYRGHIYHCTQPNPQPYQKPHALNWRYQVPGETYGEDLLPTPSFRQPRAINWRYQVVH
ncbi:MAG TPA: hypothetical protein V6C65_16470 [Allocoleopsis sp.]